MTPNKPKKLPFMQWYEADFLLSTATWPHAAQVYYRELLQAAWHREALPRSPAALAKLCGADANHFRKYWKSHVSEKFVSVRGGGLQNPRIQRDRSAVRLAGLNSKKYGSKGGKKRAENEKARQEAERKKDREEIHARARDAGPVASADIDASELVGRQ